LGTRCEGKGNTLSAGDNIRGGIWSDFDYFPSKKTVKLALGLKLLMMQSIGKYHPPIANAMLS
jgi:hypothetical protein